MRYLLALALLFSTGACSLYQSDGRKFLEKSALQYSAAAANLRSCGQDKIGEEWLKISTNEAAQVYSSESQEFALLIVPSATQTFHCTYHFSSVQEMIERTDAAIELTLDQVALWLGEFAFHPLSPVK